MKTKKDKLAIVIPTYNRKDYLRVVLENIQKQKISNVKLEIIVVIDGSTDGTIEMLQKDFSGVHIIKGGGNWWFTKCLNKGCKLAKRLGADYILTLNDDCYFDENLIGNLLMANKKLPGKGATGAITLVESKKNRGKYRVTFSGTKKFIKWRAKLVPYLDSRTEYNLDELYGIYSSCSLVTRGMLFPLEIGEEIGFFDDKNFPQYGSDEDFALRLRYSKYLLNVAYDAKIFDTPNLTSMGKASNQTTFNEFVKSFFNKYTINSLEKAFNFQKKHGNKFLLPISLLFFILGTFKAYLWKYRKLGR